ncbi:MAG TPA: peptide chain release factor 1 [Acetobacteraceae bacterium]|nr:peptide chain release factor 1 [Acetobacteraceae bacterium]
MSFSARLDRILARSAVLKAELAAGHAGESSVRAARELAELDPVIVRIEALREAEQAREEAEALRADPELAELAESELAALRERVPLLERELRLALLPRDAADERSAILEIRPAAGGEEAALFAAVLFAMYRRYAESRHWRFELLSAIPSDLDGLREGIAEITGRDVFARLKFESGVHRVQRVPETESQGRIHTSTVTVAVLPEAEEVDVAVNDADLRIDVFRASGAGGQHVNKTESAVRVTHLPTGITVSMQEEKSQHKNRAKAMKILRARLYERNRAELAASRAADRRAQVGTGDRSERIRTYNFPQGRVTDHRIGLTLYKLDRVLEGDLDPLIDPLIAEDQAARLAADQG